ncbi:MAG: hypothetical protein ACLFTK_07580 [Anaerolineales bacterium]
MPVQLYWDDTLENVLRWDLIAPWTFAEVREVQEQSLQMVQGLESFEIIINGHHTSPPNLPLRDIKSIVLHAAPNQERMIFVQAHAFSEAILNILKQLRLPKTENMYFCDHIEQAQRLIQHERKAALEKRQ